MATVSAARISAWLTTTPTNDAVLYAEQNVQFMQDVTKIYNGQFFGIGLINSTSNLLMFDVPTTNATVTLENVNNMPSSSLPVSMQEAASKFSLVCVVSNGTCTNQTSAYFMKNAPVVWSTWDWVGFIVLPIFIALCIMIMGGMYYKNRKKQNDMILSSVTSDRKQLSTSIIKKQAATPPSPKLKVVEPKTMDKLSSTIALKKKTLENNINDDIRFNKTVQTKSKTRVWPMQADDQSVDLELQSIKGASTTIKTPSKISTVLQRFGSSAEKFKSFGTPTKTESIRWATSTGKFDTDTSMMTQEEHAYTFNSNSIISSTESTPNKQSLKSKPAFSEPTKSTKSRIGCTNTQRGEAVTVDSSPFKITSTLPRATNKLSQITSRVTTPQHTNIKNRNLFASSNSNSFLQKFDADGFAIPILITSSESKSMIESNKGIDGRQRQKLPVARDLSKMWGDAPTRPIATALSKSEPMKLPLSTEDAENIRKQQRLNHLEQSIPASSGVSVKPAVTVLSKSEPMRLPLSAEDVERVRRQQRLDYLEQRGTGERLSERKPLP